MIRTYIETLLEMPWNKAAKDNHDIGYAKQILDEDHYGLEQVKERILEYLAVRNLTKKGNSPILCLAGPPGTGKTSIARSPCESDEESPMSAFRWAASVTKRRSAATERPMWAPCPDALQPASGRQG